MQRHGWILIAVLLSVVTASAQEERSPFIRRHDRDGDGRLTREEFPRWASGMFDRIDADRDGFVTSAEDRTFRATRATRGNRGNGRNRPPRGNLQVRLEAPDLTDLRYGPDERNVLDLWLAEGEGPRPLVVYFHGGGFRSGDKASLDPKLLRDLRTRGISVAAANYRLTDTAPFPAPMHDAARAVQFLRRNAGKLAIDPGRIAATGGSAGAGISLWLAFHDDLADPESEDPVLRQSTRLTAVVAQNGQTSYDPRFIAELFKSEDVEDALLPFFGLRNASEVSNPKLFPLFEEASPLHHLTKDDVPVFLAYRQPDAPVPEGARAATFIHHPRFGYALKERMDALEIPCVVRLRPDPEEAVSFLCRQFGVPDGPNGTTVHRDLEYGKVDGTSLRLDLYLPPRSAEKPRLLVWIHGGGWTKGSKAKINPMFGRLAGEGYATASVDYRLTGLTSHPDQTHDVKGAIRWLRANADRFGYDATRIGVGGGSAGGHLALMLGMTADVEELEGDIGGNLDRSSRVQAVVDLFGPSEFKAFARENERFGRRHSLELKEAASPLGYLTADDAPVLIFHGDRDPVVPLSQSRLVLERCREIGVEATLYVVEGAGHGGKQFSDNARFALVKAFLDRHLKARAGTGSQDEE